MNSRIALVLKTKNITPAEMADQIGVQRSGVSHILNGRNKPSLDFVQKLLKKYPDISMNWLLFGQGPMMNPYNQEISRDSQIVDSTMRISADSETGNIKKESSQSMQETNETDNNREERQRLETSQEGTRENKSDERRQPSLLDLFDYSSDDDGNLPFSESQQDREYIEPLRSDLRKEKMTDEGITHQKTEAIYEPPKAIYEEKPQKAQNSKRIVKIVILYSDKSFAEYNPE